jgi:membrane protease YdiL (CAAX protease family)
VASRSAPAPAREGPAAPTRFRVGLLGLWGEIPAPRWGVGDAIAGLAVAFVASAIAVAIFVPSGNVDDISITTTALLELPLWAGLLGAVVWAGRRKGAYGVATDFGLRVQPRDGPVGGLIGLVTQAVAVPVLYVPILKLLDENSDKVAEQARSLTDRAHGGGIAVLVLFVVVGAPIVEELFFRGLLLRSLERRLSPRWALVSSSVVFGLFHFQALQLPALVVFGLVAGTLAQRTGRLGPGIAAHMAFNAFTVAVLLA